jgi:hypothetical protein
LLERQDATNGRNRSSDGTSWWETTVYTSTSTSYLSSNAALAITTLIKTATTTVSDLRRASRSGIPLLVSVDPSETAPVWTNTVTVTPTAGASSASSSGLTGAQKGGIIGGVLGVAAFLLGALAFFFFVRRGKKSDTPPQKQGGAIQISGGQLYHPGILENLGWGETGVQPENGKRNYFIEI